MKINKTITMDLELRNRLTKENINTSELINRLLMIHFRDLKTEDEIIKEVTEKILNKEKKVKVQKMIDEQLQREKEMGFEHEI